MKHYLRKALFAVSLVSTLLLVGCALLTPEQKNRIRSELAMEYQDGNITRAQYDAAIEALEADGSSVDWEGLGTSLVNILLGGVLGYTGVRIQRGKPKPMQPQEIRKLKEMVHE